MLPGDLQSSYRAEPANGAVPHARPAATGLVVRGGPRSSFAGIRLGGRRKFGGSDSAGVTAWHQPEEREERTMTAATGKSADGGPVAQAQDTDPLRTSGRSRTS